MCVSPLLLPPGQSWTSGSSPEYSATIFEISLETVGIVFNVFFFFWKQPCLGKTMYTMLSSQGATFPGISVVLLKGITVDIGHPDMLCIWFYRFSVIKHTVKGTSKLFKGSQFLFSITKLCAQNVQSSDFWIKNAKKFLPKFFGSVNVLIFMYPMLETTIHWCELVE